MVSIDTFKGKIRSTELTEDDFIRIEKKLSKKRIIINEENHKTIRGFVGNINITLDYRGLWIEGSLPKYVHGTNQKTLSLNETASAFQHLGADLGIDLLEARIERVDIAENIITSYPVQEYYPILMHCKHFKRNELDNGLGFRSRNRYISFYGKMQEVKKRKEVPDEVLIGKNVLRYELRYLNNKSISSYMGIKSINLRSLLKNYKKLVEGWYSTFNSIMKMQKTMDFDHSIFQQKGLFDHYLKVKGIEAFGGMGEIIKAVHSAKANGYLQGYSNKSSYTINRLQNFYYNNKIGACSDLGKELEQKVLNSKIETMANLIVKQTNLW